MDRLLLESYRPVWLSIAQKYTRNIDESEELVQEALYRFLRSGNSVVDHEKAYVGKTIYHLYINRLRQRQYQESYRLHEQRQTPEAVDAQVPLERQQEVRQWLLRMQAFLNPAERACFLLKKAFGLDYEELESLLAMPRVNCRQHVRRARVKLERHRDARMGESAFGEALVRLFFRAAREDNPDLLLPLLLQDLHG